MSHRTFTTLAVLLLSVVVIHAVTTEHTYTFDTNHPLNTSAFDYHYVLNAAARDANLMFSTRARTTTDLATVDRTYVFGVNLFFNTNSTSALQYLQDQHSSFKGYQIWKDWWNNLPAAQRTTKWGEVVSVDTHVTGFSNYEYGPWQQQALYDTYDQMMANSSIDFFFCTTDWSGYALRNYSYYASGMEIMVAPGDSSENYYSVPGSFGSPTANTLVMTSWLPYLRVSQAKTIAVLYVTDYIYQNQLCEGVIEQAPLNNIEVVYANGAMPFSWYTLGTIDGNAASTAAWTQALKDVHDLKPDAVVVCDYGYGGEFSLKYMRDNNWSPKSVAVSSARNYQDKSLLDYVIVPSPYNPAAKYPTQAGFVDSAGYDALVRQKYGVPANALMAQATLAGMIYTNALVSAASNSTADMIIALQLSRIVSFMGISSFDAHRRQTMPALVTQQLDGGKVTHIIGPAQAAVDTIIYPMPTWSERVFKQKWGSAVEIVGTAFMILGGLIAIGWLIFLAIHWNNPVIYAASPVFCVTVIVSSLVVYGSVFTWMPNLVNNSTCAMRVWLLPLGFMAMFGSLLAKTHRIVRLFQTTGIKIIRISNLEVAAVILAIVVGQVVLSILSMTISDLRAEVTAVDPYRISKNYWTCTYSKNLKIISGVNIGYGALLLAWGVYLSVKVRKVPLSLYDESKVIGFSIYNTGVFSIIVIAIQLAVGNSNRSLTFMITAMCCFFGTTLTTCMLMGTKVKSIYWPSAFSSRSNSGNTTHHTRQTTGTAPKNHYSTSSVSKGNHSDDAEESMHASPRSHGKVSSTTGLASVGSGAPASAAASKSNFSTSTDDVRRIKKLKKQLADLTRQLEERDLIIDELKLTIRASAGAGDDGDMELITQTPSSTGTLPSEQV